MVGIIINANPGSGCVTVLFRTPCKTICIACQRDDLDRCLQGLVDLATQFPKKVPGTFEGLDSVEVWSGHRGCFHAALQSESMGA